jgi:fibronectin-binding autotransporter adhesin
VANTNSTTVGNAATNAILNVAGHLSQLELFVGNLSGAVAALYQTAGTVTASTNSGFENTSVGNVSNAFGYYYAGGGSLTTYGLAVGGENNNGSGFSGTGGNGIMDINGATVNDTGWLVMARGASNETGILNVFSGALNYAGGGLWNCWGSTQTAIVNILGGVVSNSLSTVGFNLNASGNASNTAVLNLNGGVAQGDYVEGAAGRVNFNGGTLQASAANSAFMTGLGGIYVYAKGATINDNGYAVGVNQALLAPAGNGVNGITSFTGGAGYIAPPIVTVTRGSGDTTGVGATAIAQVDLSTGGSTSGQVTNVLITCAGVNYTATPKFVLSGGGASTPATISGRTPTANSSGGFTKAGTGTVILGGQSTYTGNTTITGGKLQLADAVLHLSFDNVSGSTLVNEGFGGSAMNGTLEGAASIVSSGRFGSNCLSIPSGAATNAYVLINNPVVAMAGTNAWSLALWVKTTTAGGVYAYQGSGSWVSGNMTFYLNEGSDSGYGTKAGGVSWGQGWEEGSTTINDGKWHFLVMTCNGSTKAMYVDGNADSIASSWGASTGVGSQLWIGGSADTTDEDVGLNGLIDEVYVYNRALSQAEVQSLYSRNSTGAPVLPTNTSVTVSSGTLDVGGLSQTIASLSGAGNLILGDDSAAVGAFTVGNAANAEFDGAISDAGMEAMVKAGAGALTLTAANTYRGATIVQGGALLVNGSSASGSVTVSNGATLGGSGTVSGVVTNLSGGTLAPGASLGTIGTLTLSNPPVLNGVTLLKINRNNGAFLNDQIKLLSGTLAYGGTLAVTNIGAALQAGDSFQLFSAAAYTGVFAVTNLPALGNYLYWTNTLNSNGRLGVASAVNLVPTNLNWSVSGTNLSLSWPLDHTGWWLLMNTNGLENSNAWFAVSNSAATNQVWLPLNPAQPSAFFRLVYP